MERSIIIVDDDAQVLNFLARALRDDDTIVRTADSGTAALAAVAEQRPQVVISDMRMPGIDGLELLRTLKERAPEVEVVLMTGFDDLPTIATAMQEGATDFLVKPMDIPQLRGVIDRVFDDRRLRETVGLSQEPEEEAEQLLVGRHPLMVEVYKQVGQVAHTRTGVVIRGESGVGKELVARSIHLRSGVSEEPFIAVNCTALPATLLESELFGHVRGAFTGATSNRKGRFSMAGRGTIFLDEIGDTSPDFQSKLLRVLQEREYYPVGAERPEPVHARVISATHRNLEDMVATGEFRQDLYYRLRVVEISVPPLRDRASDIPVLARHLVRRACSAAGVETKVLAPDAEEALMAHDWPGNVRELENCITRAVVMTGGEVIRARALMIEPADREQAAGLFTLEAVERTHLQRVLAATGGHKSRTADILGISRPRLDRLIKKHSLGLEPPEATS